MKQNKCLHSICYLVLIGALILGVLSFSAEIVFGEDTQLRYESDGVVLKAVTDGETATITGCESDLTYYEVNIPEKIEGIPVCAIDENAFQNNAHITSVTLPAGITELKPYTFYACTALKSIDLNKVQSMGDEYSGWLTLGETGSLETIQVAEDNPSLTVQDGILFTKDMTTLMVYPTLRPGNFYKIPDSVTSIWSRAFNNSAFLEEVTLSSGVRDYWDSFYACPVLKKLNLNMLSHVGGDNFSNCYALEEVAVSENNKDLMTVDGILFSHDQETIYFYPPGRDGDSYTIPGGVTTIGYKAFMYSRLKTIRMPASLTKVQGYAFAYSEQLEELIFPQGLTTIETNACTGCESLAAVYVPNSVNDITYGSLDGPMMGPYAVLYGHPNDADGNSTYVYNYVQEHADEYVFKDIDQEKMPRNIRISCAEELTFDQGAPAFPLGAESTTELIYESSAPNIVSVDAEGVLRPLKAGTAEISIIAPADNYHDEVRKTIPVTVIGADPEPQKQLSSQTITGPSSFAKTFGCKAFSLKQSAKTTLSYRSSNPKIATVSAAGKVRILRPGKVRITVTAAATDEYKAAKKTITIRAKLAVPTLKSKRSGTRVRLTWNKVKKASGYELYIKYPGKKKFVRALTESAKVKSVMHRGLTKGKTYKYKLRAFTRVGGKKYYSAFSKVKTVKIR